MTSRDFCFWLQGYFELHGPKTLDEKETDLVRRHLALVFKHEIDPSTGDSEHQQELNQVHTQATGQPPMDPIVTSVAGSNSHLLGPTPNPPAYSPPGLTQPRC